MLVDYTLEDEYTDDCSIGAYYSMTENEEDEPSVIIKAHTVIDPNTMMIKFLKAHITHAAMLRPSRLRELACLAFILLLVYHIVKFISFQRSLVIRFVDDARVT